MFYRAILILIAAVVIVFSSGCSQIHRVPQSVFDERQKKLDEKQSELEVQRNERREVYKENFSKKKTIEEIRTGAQKTVEKAEKKGDDFFLFRIWKRFVEWLRGVFN